MSPSHYDELETRTGEAREAALFAALRKQIALARDKAPEFARILAVVNPASVADRTALARLPCPCFQLVVVRWAHASHLLRRR